jgi:hypothetical protein
VTGKRDIINNRITRQRAIFTFARFKVARFSRLILRAKEKKHAAPPEPRKRLALFKSRRNRAARVSAVTKEQN